MIFPVIVVMIFHSSIEASILYSWFTLIILVYLSRILLSYLFFRLNPPPQDAKKWGWYLTFSTFISGVLWGWAVCTFHVQDHLYYDVFMYVIVVGLASGSVMLTTYWLPALFAYGVPSIFGVILDLFLRDIPQKYSISLLFIVFFLMTVRIAKGINKTAYDVIRLQFENVDLIEELEKEKNKAEAASRAKTHFLASANHDLRQPVHALSLLVHGLQRELTTAQGKLLFLRLERSVKSLGNLLESLLDLSRLDADAIKVTPTYFSISPLATQLLAEYLPTASEKGLRFSVRPCEGLLYTDKTLLERLLRNLLNNAFSYTETGGVLLSFRPRGKDILIEVWDSGLGIPPKEQERIFSEFYQLETPMRDQTKGLGLGLSICQRIAKLIGSKIELKSRMDSGSVFRLRLELASKHIQIPHTASTQKQTIPLKGKKLLLIDDDVEVLQAMIQVIRNWEMTPIAARTSGEALMLLEESRMSPDAILCDHRLEHEASGLDAIKAIRTRYPAPAIMITGDTAPENIQAIQATGLPILHKPLTPEKLVAALQNLLANEKD